MIQINLYICTDGNEDTRITTGNPRSSSESDISIPE